MANRRTVYSVLVPMYCFTLLFGLTPFKIDNNNCANSKTKLTWCVLFMLFLNIYNHSVKHANTSINKSLIAIVTNFLDFTFSQCGIFFEILFNCIFANSIVYFLNKIQDLDQNAKLYFNVNLQSEYRKSKIYAITALCITLMLLTAFVCMVLLQSSYLLTFERFGEFITYFFPTIINTCVTLQFCTLIMLLRQRYLWINNKIRILSLKIENNALGGISEEAFKRTRPSTLVVARGMLQDKIICFLEKVRVKKYKLYHLGQILNKSYGVQILFVILQDFITIIAALYYSGKYLIIDGYSLHELLQYLLYSGVSCLSSILRILAIAICSSRTATEAQKTGTLIYKLMNSNVTINDHFKRELHSEVLFMSLQLLHQRLHFTVCRIFSIDAPLLFSIVGAITTYLVIVVQFELQQLYAKD